MITSLAKEQPLLLGPSDPLPVELVSPGNRSDILLLCEHAGRAIPGCLGNLGLSDEALSSHIGWDIGAEDVARRLAQRIKAPLILQRYSRLVIDANRPPGTETSIPEMSDGIAIPGNTGLSQSEKDARRSEIFDPMNEAVEDTFAASSFRAAFSIHSFTRVFEGETRPWHAGLLSRSSQITIDQMMASLRHAAPGLHLARNQPYRIDDRTDWFIPRHVEPRGLPHALIEIRNDEIDTPEGADRWAALLADAITDVMEALSWP